MLSVYRTRSSVDRYYYQIATHIFLPGSPQKHCLNWRSKGKHFAFQTPQSGSSLRGNFVELKVSILFFAPYITF